MYLKKLPAAFYRSATGNAPVRDWLRSLDGVDKRIVGQDIATAEFGWPVGMPVCRPLRRGLYEIRSALGGGRIARVIFCIVDGRMVLLHAFMKQIPQADLVLALRRKSEVTS